MMDQEATGRKRRNRYRNLTTHQRKLRQIHQEEEEVTK
jgi:hypothetical protein